MSQLIALLREVKYLLQSEQEIPESANAVYAQNDVYRAYIQNLDVIVTLYNRYVHLYACLRIIYSCKHPCFLFYCRVRDCVLAVEYPLIECKLSSIDQDMDRALSELNWTHNGRMHICAVYY